MTFGIGMGICLFKTVFRLIAEKSVKDYLKDIYNVPGVHFSDSMYFARPSRHSSHQDINADGDEIDGDLEAYGPPYRIRSFDYAFDDEYYFEDDDDEKDPREFFDVVWDQASGCMAQCQTSRELNNESYFSVSSHDHNHDDV